MSAPASAQTTAPRPRNRSEELGAGVGLVALGVVGGAFTGLTFLESEIHQFPPMCPGMGCPADPPVVGYDPNLVVMGALLGAASITSIVIGAVLYVAPALALPEAPLTVAISPSGASAALTLRW